MGAILSLSMKTLLILFIIKMNIKADIVTEAKSMYDKNNIYNDKKFTKIFKIKYNEEEFSTCKLLSKYRPFHENPDDSQKSSTQDH